MNKERIEVIGSEFYTPISRPYGQLEDLTLK